MWCPPVWMVTPYISLFPHTPNTTDPCTATHRLDLVTPLPKALLRLPFAPRLRNVVKPIPGARGPRALSQLSSL